MKTYRNLFDRIASFENLLRAARKAQLGTRFKESTALFNLNLEKELLSIQKSLLDRTYRHGPYQDFFVFDPKRRLISAAPYRDRVVHHALCNVIEPIFERSFIHDSYACRKGKGSHAAVRRYMDGLCSQEPQPAPRQRVLGRLRPFCERKPTMQILHSLCG